MGGIIPKLSNDNNGKLVQTATIKMALLGGPNVGKSTIFKQIKMAHCGGFGECEREEARIHIARQCAGALVELDEHSQVRYNTTNRGIPCLSQRTIVAIDRLLLLHVLLIFFVCLYRSSTSG